MPKTTSSPLPPLPPKDSPSPRKYLSQPPPPPSFASASNSTTTTATSSKIPSTFTDRRPLPSLIVFDLDYTLWPFWVDTHPTPPLKPRDEGARMVDRWGESYSFYSGVPAVLLAARARGIALAVASRTHAPDLARDLLKGLVVAPLGDAAAAAAEGARGVRALDFFSHVQIFPGSKVAHFRKIQDATARRAAGLGGGLIVEFADMLFFDDEPRNRDVEAELGVTFCLVRDGVTKDDIDRGVRAWRKNRGYE